MRAQCEKDAEAPEMASCPKNYCRTRTLAASSAAFFLARFFLASFVDAAWSNVVLAVGAAVVRSVNGVTGDTGGGGDGAPLPD